ncbi:MAG: hydroxyacid dehydrogenase [Bacteriovoracaceae bacterium]
MKPFIIVSDGFDEALFNELKSISEFEVHPKSKLKLDELKVLLPKASALIIRSATTVTPELVDLAPNLKLVIRAGEGTDNIDKKYCAQKGVKVANTPGANNHSAAEHAIALMFTALRHTATAHASMVKGEWEKNRFASGNELAKKTLGIIGFGRIGQIVAKVLSGFEPKVLFYDPMVKSSTIPYARKVEDINEIFKTADIISLHLPLMDSTKNLITKNQLNLMKPTSILVNASRGKIVNEDDLLMALQNKQFKAAAFDVFATEPLAADSPLRKVDNLILTPHLGASTDEAQVRVGEMVVSQIREFFINKNLVNEVKA